ncbi:MAG: Hsp20 family protein, partial [Terricaulis sp.]
MASNELNPLYRTLVGFDRIASLMDQAARLDAAPGYPPFNVEQIGEDNFRIELAVAGFGEDDLNIEFKQNSLLVTGQRKAPEQRNFLHRGIAER